MTKRSAAVAAATKLQQISAAVDDSESETSMSSDESESALREEGSHYESESPALKTISKGRPPTKRAKRMGTTTPRQTAAPVKRGKKSLSLLPTMPLDVLFEILALLSPKDLLNVSYTNKLFHETLLSSEVETIWKRALESSGAPKCPSDLKRPRWARLLFSTSCEICGAKNIQKVDFFLRRRACTRCKKKKMVVASKVASVFPKCDNLVLSLIPRSTVIGWADGHLSSSEFFWRADIKEMMHLIAGYEQKKAMHVSGAQNEFDIFIAKRVDLVKEIWSNEMDARAWLSDTTTNRKYEIEQSTRKRQEAIRAKFLELGYEEADISALWGERAFHQKAALTDSVWKRIRPVLESRIKADKAEHLAQQMFHTKNIRRRFLNVLCIDYKKTISPPQWKYLPTAVELGEKEPFKALMDAGLNVTLTIDDFTPLMSKLPEVIAEIQHDLKAKLIQQLADASEAGRILPSNCLDLATSVFRCESAECKSDDYRESDSHVVGSDSILSHNCVTTLSPSYKKDAPADWMLKYSRKFVVARPAAVGTARALVLYAGMDPEKTLASEMDNKDLRFTCKICINRKFFGYSWRNALAHACTSRHLNLSHGVAITDHLNFWRVLSPAEAAVLKENEQKDPKWESIKWTCSHCPITLRTGGMQRDAVVQHIQTVHKIISPTDPTDFFYFERVVSPFREPEKILYGLL